MSYALEVAEIWEALGDQQRAELYRYTGAPDPDALTVEELVGDVTAAVDGVADAKPNAKHDDDCWQKHTACLAERVREALPS